MSKKFIFLLAVLFTVSFVFAATATGFAQPSYTVMIANDDTLGGYLVDGQGKTLYYFTKDAPGVSNCKGQCSVLWPTFYTERIEVPAGLTASDFGSIIREDGTKQTTFRGWPLYYFNKDMKAGDLKGQKVNGVWFVLSVK